MSEADIRRRMQGEDPDDIEAAVDAWSEDRQQQQRDVIATFELEAQHEQE